MENPYLTGNHVTDTGALPGEILGEIIGVLARTKPWVTLCAVVGIVAAGFSMIMAIIGGFLAAEAAGSGGVAAIALPVFQCFISALVGLTYLFISIKLWRYGSGISRLIGSGTPGDLLQALDRQRGFWKCAGIMVILGMLLVFLALLLALFTTPVSAEHMSGPH